MSKVFQIFKNTCYHDYTGMYKDAADAAQYYAPSIEFIDAPDFVLEGWGFDATQEGDARFIQPAEPEPMPEDTAEPEESTEELLLELAADHEERICLLELGVNK